MNDTTEILAGVGWPFSQQPLNLGILEHHPILLTVADHTDLDAMADFTVNRYLTIEQASGFVPVGLKVVTTNPNVVVALNIAQADCRDPWTRHELLQRDSFRYAGVFPIAEYLEMLSLIINHGYNGLRPVINVPHLITSLDDRYTSICLTTFIRLLARIAWRCQYSALINSHEGSYRLLFETYVTYDTGFVESGRIRHRAFPVQQYYSPNYRFYAVYIPPSNESQQLYLDQAVWEVFNHSCPPPQPPQRQRDDLSPVPSLEPGSESLSSESGSPSPLPFENCV
ncbi:hypothetical protein CHU98_g954 [Xylaria longipes]|nr:hypothetical protein CHU98_g954 [Xylaria longipes]